MIGLFSTMYAFSISCHFYIHLNTIKAINILMLIRYELFNFVEPERILNHNIFIFFKCPNCVLILK